MILKCAVFLGDIRWGIFFSNRLVGELCDLVDVMYILYAKPHGSMFIYFIVKKMCTFRRSHVDYVVK